MPENPVSYRVTRPEADLFNKALSREHGLSSGTLSNALIRPWPRGEEIIASAIGLPPEEIWPSRYRSKRYRVRKRNTISPDFFAV
ncbi:helix-turn-helix domain-containing protein [Mixta mediterraneensis]|uniref:helix-turn-helix domain-containing protein n=1 Tax=Mixta mediterraneensis TaxID=2758443 RepID=UPI00187449B9|nr:helix-turn-helix domain-containing protein [Mixta mediterraneensis]MBE5252783.1 helix-turn-helix domain-containing protein [Mixta mediterraneensis]